MQSLMPPIDSSDSLFHNGNPLTGEKGTIVTADWLNNVQSAIRAEQSELIAVLTAAGLTPDSEQANQLLSALNVLYAAKSTLSSKQDKNDNLTALAALTGAADRLTYFTAAKTLALSALTGTGRDIIGKATIAEVVSYLGLGPGRMTGIKTFTASGTYTPTAGTKFVKVIVTGAGGGGAGTNTASSSGGCGGAGGTAIKFLTVTAASYVVTVGTAGTAGASGYNAGGYGGSSVFSTSSGDITGGGGGGGTNTGSGSGLQYGGGGGVASGGDMNITGGDGCDGDGNGYSRGNGGASFWGGGARKGAASGLAGTAYGSGGSARFAAIGAGGTGASGVVYIEEYA